MLPTLRYVTSLCPCAHMVTFMYLSTHILFFLFLPAYIWMPKKISRCGLALAPLHTHMMPSEVDLFASKYGYRMGKQSLFRFLSGLLPLIHSLLHCSTHLCCCWSNAQLPLPTVGSRRQDLYDSAFTGNRESSNFITNFMINILTKLNEVQNNRILQPQRQGNLGIYNLTLL